MQIVPTKFFVKRLAFGKPGDFGLDEFEKPLNLNVDATKESDSIVRINLHLQLELSQGQGIDVQYAVDFEITDDAIPDFKVMESMLEHRFLQINAPAIAYPYLRAFISTFCINAGYAGVMIPPVNFQAIYEKRVRENALGNTLRLEGAHAD